LEGEKVGKKRPHVAKKEWAENRVESLKGEGERRVKKNKTLQSHGKTPALRSSWRSNESGRGGIRKEKTPSSHKGQGNDWKRATRRGRKVQFKVEIGGSAH